MNREGPKALGTRPEPVGAPNCLNNMTFVISGEFETLTKEQTRDIVMRYGGRVTSAVSGKTTYLLRGRDAGESKLAKAKQIGTKVLDEDGFYQLVESSSPKEIKQPNAPSEPTKETDKKVTPTKALPSSVDTKGKQSEAKYATLVTGVTTETSLWTDKYRPKTIQDIIGNKEMVKRINDWLANYDSHKKAASSQAAGDSDIHSYRAILISGPPGIGKTTTAHVVAETNGYEALEFNASDVRNKKILEQNLSEMMDNRTMTEFFQTGKPQPKGKKVVLIMDEVDGMSAGDRGGAAELAAMIRKTKIPIICICNDVRSPKVGPLLRVCFDARFKRTPANQIRPKLMTIAFKEKLDINPNAIEELVSTTQNDIRQIINILSTYRLNNTSMGYDDAKRIGKTNQKNTILNPFEIPGELLASGNWRQKTLNEKYEIYFHDYNLSPLMFYENYCKVKPQKASLMSTTGSAKEIACNEMELIAKAAEAIADGDLVDSMIHGSSQQYSLMPVQSIFSCVRPAYYMEGYMQTRTGFPSWLGNNSKAAKYSRLLSDLQTRMRVKASGDRSEIRLNYLTTLNERIFGNVAQENYEEAIEYMDNYYLDRENLETLSDLVCTTTKPPLVELPAKTKTAFTRKYNSVSHPVLFQPGSVPIKKAIATPTEDMMDTLVEEDTDYVEDTPEEEEDSSLDADISDSKYIKESKKRKNGSSQSSQSKKASSSQSSQTKRARSKK
ncbi:DNA replication factor C, large subunit [Rhizopus microsporus]|uniref:Replication factor C subunit 1 n=1 Tax=Rhizopus microsporus TaxID=58291 RepID=A0A1X0S0J8_RHIZD|nr:DNA replication factor C, large subunit [Rhizopus microsporus]